MYSAKQRALAPLLTALFATEQVGKLMFFRPAFWASALMPVGVMSAVPTICCCLSSLPTVLRPLTLMTIATAPNATSTTAATNPPISNTLRMTRLLSLLWLVVGMVDRMRRHAIGAGAE